MNQEESVAAELAPLASVKTCCKDAGNLYRRKNDPEERKDLAIYRCRVCGCRHFRLTADPGKLGLRGAEVGG